MTQCHDPALEEVSDQFLTGYLGEISINDIHHIVVGFSGRKLKMQPNIANWTPWSRDEIDPISQTTFLNAFSWIKINELCLEFHWSLFLRFELTIFQHWFKWLGADQATSHYLNQWWLAYWRIYASLGLKELNILNLAIIGSDNALWPVWCYDIIGTNVVLFSTAQRNKVKWNFD